MARRWRRRLVRGSVAVAAVVVAAGLTLPWWWPAVVATWGSSYGLQVGDWETDAWSTVELREVTYVTDGLRVTAESVRVPAFGRWPLGNSGSAVDVRGVEVVTSPSTRPADAPPGTPPSTRAILVSVMQLWPTLKEWLPSAHIDGAAIVSGPVRIELDALDWDGTRIHVVGRVSGRSEVIDITVVREADDTLRVVASAAEQSARIEASAAVVESGVNAAAAITWNTNTAQLAAKFDDVSLVPLSAALEAARFEIPASQFGLDAYGPVRGSLHASWAAGKYEVLLHADAQPLAAATADATPPVAVDLEARGDFTTLQVESAFVRLPGIDAMLSDPLAIDVRSGRPASAAIFSVDANLAEIPWRIATGRLTGRVAITGGPETDPRAEFSLQGSELAWRDAAVGGVDIAGSWTPQTLAITRGEVRLGSDSTLDARGNILLADRQLAEATLSARVTAAALRPWLPQLPEFAEVALAAKAAGPLDQVAHSGELRWRDLQGMPGGNLSGTATWNGTSADEVAIVAAIDSAAGVQLPLDVIAQRAADGSLLFHLRELAWRSGADEWWRLAEPVRFAVTLPDGGAPLALKAADVRLTGEDIGVALSADLRWPVAGELSIEAHDVAASHLAALLPESAQEARLDALNVHAIWDDGPVNISGSLRATYQPDASATYAVEAEYRTDGDDLAVGALRVLDATGVVLAGEGRLPLSIAGRATGFQVELPRDGAINLSLTSTPNPTFWESVTRLTKWEIEAPAMAARLTGSLAAPRGTITFGAGAVKPPPGLAGTAQLPRFSELLLELTADDAGVGLTTGRVKIEDNWVSLVGHAPWSLWQEWRDKGGLPWRQADFSFAADRMPMAIAARALPTLLAPDGDVSFELEHRTRGGFTGFLWLNDAALRAIPSVGTVRSIGGEVRLNGYELNLPRLGALIGGRPIGISGKADVRDLAHPIFDLKIASSRVPLVRQEGIVMRADLDVRVQQTAEKPAHISGSVALGQSVFVSDLVSLLPTGGGVAAPEQRPPYFSVKAGPFADWTLDVAVEGEDFLRVENPFFRGTISAGFQLTGTLAEPQALGRAWADDGVIIFPFGNLRVEQLEVSLARENPYEPALRATAASRVYGFNIRLDVSGSASEPRLQFTSEPALSSQAVFLMLSTGEMPDTGNQFTSSDRARRLAMFVGRNLANTLGLVGSGDGGEERLIVRSGEDFSREGGETITIQYNLDDRWSVVAEKDRFDAYNGGIKFRVIDR